MIEKKKRKIRSALTYSRRVIAEQLSCMMNSYCLYDEDTDSFTDESRCTLEEANDLAVCRKALKKIAAALECAS